MNRTTDTLICSPLGDLVIDLRYSAVPNETDPLWGIPIERSTPHEHLEWWTSRDTDAGQRARVKSV